MDAEKKELAISIDAASVVKTVAVLALVYALWLLRDLVLVILTAVVIASAVEPAAQRFVRFRIPRLPAVILIYAVVGVVLFGLFYFLVPSLLSDTAAFLSKVPEYFGSIDLSKLLDNPTFANSRETITGISETLTARDLITALRSYLVNIPGSVLSTVSTVFGGAFSFILITVFSFYLSVQEDGIENFLRVVTPFRHQRYAIGLWKRTQTKIGKWMQGQLVLMLIIGILVYLGLTIVGVKHALLFAILAGLFELIPVFGPVLSAIPAVAAGLVDGGLTLGLIIAGLYIIIQQFENHLIYPLVVNKVVGVPPLLVILALVIGGTLAGFLGVLLSVPAAAALVELTTDIRRRNKELEEREAMRAH